MNLRTWAVKWGIPAEALLDLESECLGLVGTPGVVKDGRSEAYATSAMRLDSAQHGALMMRNNVGAFETNTGSWVRFGLLNESEAMNKKIKSADWVGVRKVLIEQRHVGLIMGQFAAREMKKPGWVYTGAEREPEQLAFNNLINSYGGDAKFATGRGSFE